MTDAPDPVELVSRILIDHGALSRDDVAERLRADNVPDPESLVRDVLNEMTCPAVPLLDDRWVWLPTLLAGRVFTHRVDSREIAHDLLAVTPDLDPITELCEYAPYREFADGSPVTVVVAGFDDDLLDERNVLEDGVDEGGALLLAPGTLGGLGAVEDDLIGVRLTDAGLIVERITAVVAAPDVGDRFVEAMASDEPTSISAAVWQVCLDDPAAYIDAVVPLTEMIAARGLALHGETVTTADFDYATWRFERDCDRLALRYDIDADDAFALRTLVAIYGSMSMLLTLADEDDEEPEDFAARSDDDPPSDVGYGEIISEVGAALGDPYLARLLRFETVGRGGSPAALGLFAETVEPQVPRSARVAYRWLRGVAHEQLGDTEAAEREYFAAESMDTEWQPVLLDLARFASDRGDAERGLALLRRGDAGPDHPLQHVLEQHRAAPRTDVGRNEACWCGSGRKYKKCHLGREGLPLEDRVKWLYFKACQHVMDTAWLALLDEVADVRAADAATEQEADALADDPLVMDAVLFEGGAFEDFLSARGSLLPADERALAEQWLRFERSLFDVEQVSPGRSMVLRDVRTGDVHEVRERTASRQLTTGQLICTRVAPVGDAFEMWGGVEPVALHARSALIELLDDEANPADLVEFLSARFAPPTLVNTEGDPMMMCEATVRVGSGIELALDDAYDRDGDAPRWHQHVTTDGMDRIRTFLTLDGDTLTVQTNSERRMDRVLATLAGLDPSATVLDDVRQAPPDVRRLAPHGRVPTPNSPEVLAALDDMMGQYETRWLDDSIPALDGLTPRQAADDPTRRADLIRLLDSFPTVEGGMSGARLREALGL